MNSFASRTPVESLSGALSGRTALVTGASRGIGASIADALAGAGARVALLARTREAIEASAARIGNDSFAVAADLAVKESTVEAIELVRESFSGAPDILVSNAGIFQLENIEAMTPEDFGNMAEINLVGPFRIIRAFLPAMRERGSGHVVTIGSVADRVIFAGNAGYSATKFGMRAVHHVLREETRGSGVRATLVSPSGVDTDIWEPIRFPGSSGPPDRTAMMDPDAVAHAVMYAVTQPASVNIDELRLSRS